MIKYGIKRLTLLPRTLTPDPQAYHHVLLHKDAFLEITEDGLKDVFDRNLPNWINFKIEAESIYNNIDIINMATQYAAAGAVMAEVESQHSGAGVFVFSYDNYLGYDFELNITPNERTLKHIAEAKFEYFKGKAIVNAARTNVGEWGNNSNLAPWLYVTSKINYFGNFFDPNWIKDFKLTLKTVSEKTILNRSLVNYYELSLEVTSYESKATVMKNLLDLSLLTNVVIRATDDFEINIGQGVLFPERQQMIGQKERNVKLMFSGKIPINSLQVINTQNKIVIS
jgi:hypothetical protein